MKFSTNILRLVVLALPVSIAGLANAQSKPFDDTCIFLTQITSDAKTDCNKRSDPVLSYNYSFGSNSSQGQLALNGLVEKFGEPDSVRGNNHLWRIENPIKGASQKKTITIILTHDPSGESAIMMDRVRPGSVSAEKKRRVKKRNEKRVNKPKARPVKRKVRENDAF